MANIERTLPIGVQSKFFVGSVAATGTVLTQVRARRTNGLAILDVTPAEYVPALRRFVPTDFRRVELTANFYNDGEMVWKLANNTPLSGDINDAQDFTEKYVVFVVDTVSGSDKCYIIHEAQVATGRNTSYKKNDGTVVPITFTGIDNEDPSFDPVTKGTLSELRTILGVRDPFV